jgi:predicted metal-dependent hydrolase
MKAPATQLSLFETRGSRDPFAVRVSARARRLTARVHVGGRVEIVVPVGVNARAVRDFVQRFTPWIDRKVAAMQCFAQSAASVPERIDLAYTGERFSVEWQESVHRGALGDVRSGVRLQGDRLVVRARDSANARETLQDCCQRTRWGSCSTRGTVSLNCSLVFLAPEVVRYLFVHELAHTQHMNHSPAFWRLVESLEPDYRRLDRELLAGWRTVPLWVFGT